MIEEQIDFTEEQVEKKPSRWLLKVFVAVVLAGVFTLLVAGTYIANLNKPVQFNEPVSVSIEEGDNVPVITEKLEKAGVIQSAELLYLVLVFMFDPTDIKASQYVFAEPLTTMQVAEKLIKGDFATDLSQITIFEGESREKIADRLNESFNWFESNEFLKLTSTLEGQLFPDTYFVPKNYTTKELVELLHTTYNKTISEYESDIVVSGLSEIEVVTLASIVEREANTPESMKVVAGIFLNRLEIGMALQADASIEYVLEHELNELRPGQLAESLREIDSPYNTYLYPGLPPTPIGNPGRDAIEAVLNPTVSDYMYYITGDDGEFYYAESYNQHLINISNHLR